MADGIYVGMSAAVARAQQLDAVADNLANAQTPGFKAARPAFQAFLPAGGAPEQSYTAAVSTGTDTRPGVTTTTGNPLDIVPTRGAFLGVRLSDGSLGYTRNGRLSVDRDGILRAGAHPVVNRGGGVITIPPHEVPTVQQNGTLRAAGVDVGALGFFEVNGPLDRLPNAVFTATPTTQATPVDAQVAVGELELGNSNALESTVQLISAQRHFETSMQAITTYRRLDERANELGKVR